MTLQKARHTRDHPHLCEVTTRDEPHPSRWGDHPHLCEVTTSRLDGLEPCRDHPHLCEVTTLVTGISE